MRILFKKAIVIEL